MLQEIPNDGDMFQLKDVWHMKKKKPSAPKVGEFSPELSQTIAHLAEEAKKKRLSVFVGAGCSIPSGLPGWCGVLSSLLAELEFKAGIQEPLRLAQLLEKKLGPVVFREKICNKLRTPLVKRSPLLQAIANLPTNLFITTNFDHLLEEELRQTHGDCRIITNPMDIPSIDPLQRTLVKIHGDIDSPVSLKITEKDYIEFRVHNEPFVRFLEAQQASKTILFLGVSFQDNRLREVDDQIIRMFGIFRREPYLVTSGTFPLPEMEPGESATSFKERCAATMEERKGDFEVFLTSLESRGIRPVVLPSFDDLPEFLRKISTETQSNLDDQTSTGGRVISEEVKILKEELKSKICKEIQERYLIPIQGDEKGPGLPFKNAALKARELLLLLKKEQSRISSSFYIKALGAAANAFLNLLSDDGKKEAGKCLKEIKTLLAGFPEKETSKMDLENTLARLEAKAAIISNEPDRAIALLRDRIQDDPKAVSMWLIAMERKGRGEEVRNFIENHPSQEAWIPVAISLLAQMGSIPRARQLFADFSEKSGKKPAVVGESRLLFAEGLLLWVVRSVQKGETGEFSLSDIPPEKKALLEEALELVKGETNPKTKEFSDAFDFRGNELCINLTRLLGRTTEGFDHALKLVRNGSLIPNAAYLFQDAFHAMDISSKKENFADFLNLVKQKYPKTLWALFPACEILLEFPDHPKPEEAFELLKDFETIAQNENQKAKAAHVFLHAALQADKGNDAFPILLKAFGSEHPLTIVFQARIALLDGRLDEGRALLDNMPAARDEETLIEAKLLRAQMEMQEGSFPRAFAIFREMEKAHSALLSPAFYQLFLNTAVKIQPPETESILFATERLNSMGRKV